jgi:hypothetical protein
MKTRNSIPDLEGLSTSIVCCHTEIQNADNLFLLNGAEIYWSACPQVVVYHAASSLGSGKPTDHHRCGGSSTTQGSRANI